MYYNNSNGCSRVCLKRGPRGPQGPEGPEGPEGPQGPAGQTVNSLQYSVLLEQSGNSKEFVLAGVDPRSSYNFVPPGDPQKTYTIDYTTPSFGVYNNHLYITIVSITLSDVSGKITVTGTSISESSAVPKPGQQEDIYITDTKNGYKLIKLNLQM